MRRLLRGILLSLVFATSACASGDGNSPAHDPSELEPETAREPLRSGERTARTTSNVQESAIRLIRNETDCRFIVEWQLGHIDERFALTPTDIERAMDRVQELWGDAIDQFELTRTSDLGIVIDFRYDDRQALIDNESDEQERLREQEILITRRQAEFEEKRSRFERANQAFLQRSEEIQRQVDSLNEWVREVNDGGGFTDEQLSRFEAERDAIDHRQLSELAQQTELETFARELNQAMARLNEAIDRRNEMIDRYNEAYAGQRLFTSGHFQRTNGRDTITIYQFQGETGLQRVLAHELGHALGLDHLENPEAIMFERVSGHPAPVALRLTQQDRQAIRDRCNSLHP